MSTKIFISYGREDVEAAKKIYSELKAEHLDPWLDKESLLPGQKWKVAIKKAIRESRYFLALLSSHSVSRKGFVNKELSDALEVLEEYPESEIFLIPVRLDDCQPSHERLSELHRVDMFPSWGEGMRQIKKAINLKANNTLLTFIRVRCKNIHFKTFLDSIGEIPEVETAYAIFGKYDLLVVIAATNDERRFQCIKIIEELPWVEDIETEFGLKPLHRLFE
jgi:DNA-binding Lrp family transcriptional regulator